MQQSKKGFTLIELIIAVSIIAILAVIAVPSYMNQMRRSHRTDAMSALLRVAAEQEKFYFQNSRYATLAELGSPATEQGYYTLEVTENDGNTFTATATAPETSPQHVDADCLMFSITAAGIRTATSENCWR